MAKRKNKTTSQVGGRAPGWMRRRLARWLADWDLEQALAAVPAPAGAWELPASDTAAGVARCWLGTDAEADLVAGQIRLFAPAAGAAAATRLYHVAVLGIGGDGVIRLAPFGRFAEPAFPGEWETGRKSLPLRVLCLWNTRLVSPAAARASWVVDQLRPAELQRALAVLAGCAGPDPWRRPQAPDLGPPLVHPDDPRHIYRFRETVCVDALVRELASGYASRTGNELRLAAEPPPDDFPPPKPQT